MSGAVFQKATKRAVRARVLIDGPSGAGKSFTALIWAQTLGKKIAAIDTERGSLSLYSDRFDFDVLEIAPPYEPQRLVEAIKAAEDGGYDVVIIDSLSHFWEGEGGVIDIVDAAASRAHNNSFAGWKVGTPEYRHLVDTMLGVGCHVIATARTKTEWVLETNDKGKQVPRRIGMAPVARQGLEYEFTLVADMDLEHRIAVSKSRCDALADLVVPGPRAEEMAKQFADWLASGEPLISRTDVDVLVQAMNDHPQRVEVKKAFMEAFGRPNSLTATKLADARAFIAAFGGSAPDQGPGGNGGEAEPGGICDATPQEPTPEPDPEPDGPGGGGPPPEAPAAEPDDEGRELALVGAPDDDLGAPFAYAPQAPAGKQLGKKRATALHVYFSHRGCAGTKTHECLALLASQGRTRHFSELVEEEELVVRREGLRLAEAGGDAMRDFVQRVEAEMLMHVGKAS